MIIPKLRFFLGITLVACNLDSKRKDQGDGKGKHYFYLLREINGYIETSKKFILTDGFGEDILAEPLGVDEESTMRFLNGDFALIWSRIRIDVASTDQMRTLAGTLILSGWESKSNDNDVLLSKHVEPEEMSTMIADALKAEREQ